MVHDEEQEVLKSLYICEKTGVKGRHTRAEFLETERIKSVGWFRKMKEGQNRGETAGCHKENAILKVQNSARSDLHSHSNCPNPFPFSKVSNMVSHTLHSSCWQMQGLPNPHSHCSSFFWLVCLSALSWTITEKTPRSGNCLLTAFQLQLKWKLAFLWGLLVTTTAILRYPHTSLKTSHKCCFLHSNIRGIDLRCPLSFKHSSFEKVIIN